MKKIKKKSSMSDENIISFLNKKYKLPDFEEEEIDIESFVKLNSRNYENDLEVLPKLLSIFGILVAKALKKKMNCGTAYEVWKAQKSKQLRSHYDKNKIKYTEAKIENDIRSDEIYIKMKNNIYKAEENYEIIKSVYWSIQKKGDILLEISKQRSQLGKLDNARKN